jgi:hypothetical protein
MTNPGSLVERWRGAAGAEDPPIDSISGWADVR